MGAFTVVVTADAFRASAPASEEPLVAAGLKVVYPPRMSPLPEAELIAALGEADAVVAGGDAYTDRVLAACPRLRVVARWGTGYDSVDLPACTRHGVIACNAPGLNVEAVADYTVGMMLALGRRLVEQVDLMRAGGWAEIRGVELFRKTVGIVGYGRIGRAVARRLSGFDCRILVYDPFLPGDPGPGAELCALDDLLRRSDVVTIHAALTPDSRGLLDRRRLGLLPPHAFLVNAARGSVVDEDALLDALRQRRIAGAALDAFVQEPLPPNHPLRALPNCLCTPHSAFNTEEAAAATNRAVAEAVLAVLSGRRPECVLNPEVLESGGVRGG